MTPPSTDKQQWLPYNAASLRMAAYRAVSEAGADTTCGTSRWGRHSLRRAVADRLVDLVTPILDHHGLALSRSQAVLAGSQAALADAQATLYRRSQEAQLIRSQLSRDVDRWRARHASTVIEARRQAARADALAVELCALRAASCEATS